MMDKLASFKTLLDSIGIPEDSQVFYFDEEEIPPPKPLCKGCSVDGCENKSRAKGMCSKHYQAAKYVPVTNKSTKTHVKMNVSKLRIKKQKANFLSLDDITT